MMSHCYTFLRHQFVYDRLVHSSELWKGSAAFLQHGHCKGTHIWILSLSGSHELTTGFLLSVSAPHHPHRNTKLLFMFTSN